MNLFYFIKLLPWYRDIKTTQKRGSRCRINKMEIYHHVLLALAQRLLALPAQFSQTTKNPPTCATTSPTGYWGEWRMNPQILPKPFKRTISYPIWPQYILGIPVMFRGINQISRTNNWVCKIAEVVIIIIISQWVI